MHRLLSVVLLVGLLITGAAQIAGASTVSGSIPVGTNATASIAPATSYWLVILRDGSGLGSVLINGTPRALPWAELCPAGATVTLTAMPAAGYEFDLWSAGVISRINPITLTMTSGATIYVRFVPATVPPTLTMATCPADGSGGSVTPDTGPVKAGDEVPITATPQPGWSFAGWIATGGASVTSANSASTTATLVTHGTVTAAFAPAIAGPSCAVSGRITFAGASLAGVYMSGLPLAAPTDANGIYAAMVPVGWSGTVTPRLTNYGFGPASRQYESISTDQTTQDYTAFQMYWLSIEKYVPITGTHGGIITVDGVPCEVPNALQFASGSSVELRAVPDPGWEFIVWWEEGLPERFTNPITVTMDMPRAITVDFAPIQHMLTVAANPADGSGGTVTPASGLVNEGEAVPIAATAADEWRFLTWITTGGARVADPGSASTTVTLSADGGITAIFAREGGTVNLMTDVSPAGAGSISLSPPGGVYPIDSPVTLTASAATGYRFDHWVINGVPAGSVNPRTLNLLVDTNVTAVFTSTNVVRYWLVVLGFGTGTGSILVNGTPYALPWAGLISSGSSVTLEAVPAEGCRFDNWWQSGIVTRDNPTTFTMTSGKTVSVQFLRN